jgi:hypothetical protein
MILLQQTSPDLLKSPRISNHIAFPHGNSAYSLDRLRLCILSIAKLFRTGHTNFDPLVAFLFKSIKY